MKKPPATAEKRTQRSTQPDDLREAIERAVADAIPARDTRRVVDRLETILVSEHHSGPLPHPSHLRDYADLIPDGPDRIMRMAERNLDHNIDLQDRALRAEIVDRRLGLALGWLSLVILVLGAVASVYLDAHPTVPIAFLGASALGGVGMLIKGRNGS